MGSTVVFNTLIQQIFADLNQADAYCDAIKTDRHCGSHHVELDALQASLKTGMGDLKSAADAAAKRSPSAQDLAEADDVMTDYAKETKHVRHKLDKIAKGHHSHHHHVEHPHFKELRLRWEDALKGIVSVLQGLKKDEKAEVNTEEVEKSKTIIVETEEVVAEKEAKNNHHEEDEEGKREVLLMKKEEVKAVEGKIAELKIEEKRETKETIEAQVGKGTEDKHA